MVERPVLRPLEPVPIEHEGERLIAFRDTTGLCPGLVMVRPAAYFLLAMLDGSRTCSEAISEFERQTGASLEVSALHELLEQLEKALILDGPRARQALASLSERPAAHTGSAYPGDPEELTSFLEGILAGERPRPSVAPLEGLLAPHIDLQRGRASYSLAYNDLLMHGGALDTFVVLGISHAPARKPYILTRKPFMTPYGSLPTDAEFVEELAAGCDFDPFADEYNHLGEHSVEFQAVFLAYLERKLGRPLKLVPVLCGSFHEGIIERRSPEELRGVGSFLASLKAAVSRRPGRVCLIAGADLAHKGLRFGEPAVTQRALQQLEAADRQSLQHAAKGDFEAFFATLQADRGARNYCGTSAIYTMLWALEGRAGVLHGYEQCNEADHSTVTVAAAGYYRA